MANVVLLDEVDEWFVDLAKEDPEASDTVAAAIDMLVENGPTLGRPIVDRVKGSKNHNMKEIRPSGTNIRILFIFDRTGRCAVGGRRQDRRLAGLVRHQHPDSHSRYERWLAGEYD